MFSVMPKKHLILIIVLFFLAAIIRTGPPPADLAYFIEAEGERPQVRMDISAEIFDGFNFSFFGSEMLARLNNSRYISYITGSTESILFSQRELRNENLRLGDIDLDWHPQSINSSAHLSSDYTVDFEEELEDRIDDITGKGFVEALRRGERTTAIQENITTHEVQPGENLWSIAGKYDINIDTLIGANDIKNMNNIMPGDELTILPVKGIKYKIGPGDSLAEIVSTYDLDRAKVMRANELSGPDDLDTGDVLILPGAEPEFGYQDRLNQMLIRPVDGRVSSPFGPRWGSHHDGIDYAVPTGTPVRAAGGGRVVHVGYSSGYGRTVIVEHQDGMRTLYAHLNSYQVSQGQRVNRGQIIARSGNTGRSTGPHLHFEVRVNGRPVNPENYLRN